MENNNDEQSRQQGSSINIKEFLWLCLSRWYWFVIALALSCGYAVYYLAKTPQVYCATAAILVKDGAGATPDVPEVFSDMASFNTNVNLNNEMVALKSPVLADEVAHRLGLDVNYSVKDKLTSKIIFGSTLPATIEFLDLGENGQAHLKMQYSNDGKLVLSQFVSGDGSGDDAIQSDNIELTLTEEPSDTLQTPVGNIIVTPNEKFIANANPAELDITVDRVGYDAAVGRILSTLNTEVRDNYSSVIYILLNDTNTERAKDEMQTLIEVYNENWIRDRNQISVSTSNFIAERIGVIESELGDVDTQISDYQAQHQISNTKGPTDALLNKKDEAQEEFYALSEKLTVARMIRDHLANAAKNYQPLPAATAIDFGNVQSLILSYNEELANRNLLVNNASETNPLVQDIDYVLNQSRQDILSAIDGYILSLNTQLKSKQSKLSTVATRLTASPTLAKHLLDKERQQKVKESLYLYLLQKREENELSQAFTAYNTKVVMTPTVSGPISPQPRKTMTMAVAIGILLPGGLIFLLEMLNSKVRGRKDIEKLTIPFVGEIPQHGKPTKNKKKLFGKKKPIDRTADIVVKKGGNNIINEAFRVVRTNLEFMIPGDSQDSRVIMLTSANPGSGKTFISLNLATVLSLKGKRVALVDLDLRKGSLSQAVGATGAGLSNYLVGGAKLDDIVIKDASGNEFLDVYPCGPIPPNPAELLYSDKLNSMIDKLREEYDFIILDAPPAEVVADAKIINRLVDVTLFVIRAGLLERSMLSEVQRFYNENRYKNMAIVLNGTLDPTASRMNRSYSYGYGYSYSGYDYGYKGYVYGDSDK